MAVAVEQPPPGVRRSVEPHATLRPFTMPALG